MLFSKFRPLKAKRRKRSRKVIGELRLRKDFINTVWHVGAEELPS